MTEVTK